MRFVIASVLVALVSDGVDAATCAGTVYLTLDTGNMQPAEEMASVLKKH